MDSDETTAVEESGDIFVVSGRYRVLRVLGDTLWSRTFLGEDTATGAQVVVKELAIERLEDWKELELFERGAQTLEHLAHPGIPRFHAVSRDASQGRIVLVQDFVDGVDLGQEVVANGVFTARRLQALLEAMLDILEYLHSFSPPVVHRDIKPSNIMLRPDGRFVLVDFDVVQTTIPGEVGGTTVVGTTGYAPPEQYFGRAQPASDYYALGATLLYVGTGVEPREFPLERGEVDFEAQSARLPHAFERLVAVLMRADVARRPQMVSEVRRLCAEVGIEIADPGAPRVVDNRLSMARYATHQVVRVMARGDSLAIAQARPAPISRAWGLIAALLWVSAAAALGVTYMLSLTLVMAAIYFSCVAAMPGVARALQSVVLHAELTQTLVASPTHISLFQTGAHPRLLKDGPGRELWRVPRERVRRVVWRDEGSEIVAGARAPGKPPSLPGQAGERFLVVVEDVDGKDYQFSSAFLGADALWDTNPDSRGDLSARAEAWAAFLALETYMAHY